jgi:dipeptide transport system permease protein
MIKFLLKKFFKIIPTIFGICLLSFLVIRFIPGDPVILLLGERGNDPEVYAQMKKSLGLDLPVYTQFFSYMGNVLKGDLGKSIITGKSIISEFFSRFPATLELSFTAMIFALSLGIPLGVLAAVKRGTLWDFFLMSGSLIGYSMPIFWWGLLLILFFSVNLAITPVSGRIDVIYYIEPWTNFILIDSLQKEVISQEGFAPFLSALKHLILPTIAMGTIPMAVIARMTRSSMLEVLDEEYIKTAKAKGQSNFKIIFKHAFKNALIPIITVTGLMLGSMVTGAILTETIFSWPGIGKWIVASVNQRDYPAIQGGVLLIGTLVVLINRLVDILYYWANPRLR